MREFCKTCKKILLWNSGSKVCANRECKDYAKKQ